MRARSAIVVSVVIVLAASIASGAGAASAPGWFGGTWNTDFGAMTIRQTGASIKGDYGVGTITGTVSGNVLTGTWTQGSETGRLTFTLSSNGDTWTGLYAYGQDTPNKQWNALNTRHAPRPKNGGTDLANGPATFSGNWNTDLGGMTLKQDGSVVTGTYEGGGSIYGKVVGRTLRGTWKQKTNTGKLRFNISADGSKFVGSFGHGSALPSFRWNGARRS